MAVEIGVAADSNDLLSRLVNFLTTNSALVSAGQQWTVMRDQSPLYGGVSGLREVHFKAPGLSGTEEWFMQVASFESIAGDYYNWHIAGQVGFLGTEDLNGQPGRGGARYLHLTNGPMPYWFVANGRRVIIVAKVSTTYQHAYLGAYLPYGTPAQYPYAMFIGGSSSNSGYRWSNNGSAHKSYVDPSWYSTSMYYPDGSWYSPNNTNNAASPSRQQALNMDPYEGSGQTRETFTVMRDNIDGTYSLYPIRITQASPAQVFGELDGVYAVSGFNNAAENIITVGGVPHLVVQDIFRTDRWNYCAVALA